MDYTQIAPLAQSLKQNISRVIVGKEQQIELILAALLSGGHILLEDVPGTGKTTLAKALARSLSCGFARVQFTPDLLPADITGTRVYHQAQGGFSFIKGPAFTNILLADEINRATPRTQSALLEAMEEGQVTVDGITRAMAQPFMVMATQNPIESYGTFPLPEAQMDRFFMRLSMGYMEREQEMAVMARPSTQALVQELEAVVTLDEIMSLRSQIQEVHVSEDVAGFILDIVQATRKQGALVGGVSTRGAIALYKASQVTAAMAGRDYVIPEDVVKEALPVLAHRLTTASGSRADGESFLRDLIATLTVPLEDVKAV